MQLAIGPVDFAILLAYLAAVVALGMWVGRGQTGISDYLLGGRDLPWWALLGSIVATETSTATFLSVPGIAFAAGGDLRFLQLAIGYIVGRCIVALVFLPQYFRGDLYTAYQVLDRRFGGATRQTASLLFLVARNLGDGLRLFLAAIVLEKMIGLSLTACVVVVGIVTIAYTFFGGIKSVVWNDCVQFVVYMTGGLVAGAIMLGELPEGWRQFVTFATENEKLRLFDFGFDVTVTYTFWAGLIGGMFLTLGTHGTDQMLVQRYLCARSRRDATRALVLSGVVVFAQFALFLLLGVGLAAFYQVNPPTVPFEKPDEAFAAFIVDYLPVGVLGLVLAAVFAAAMSTLSSSLNSSATAALNDFYIPLQRTEPSQAHLMMISRLLTVAFGLIQIGIGIVAQTLAGSVVEGVLAIAGFTAGILLGVFFLGVLTRRVGQLAALVGMLCGLAVVASVAFGTAVAWPWYAAIGAGTTFFVGLAGSLIWPETQRAEEGLEIES